MPVRQDKLSSAILLTNVHLGVKIFLDDDETTFIKRQYLKAVSELEWGSVPGNCILKRLGTTNAQVFKYDFKTNSLCHERLQLVYDTVVQRICELRSGVVISDSIYAFIKPEPHKKQKIEDGRLRLISGISLVDSLVDRILFRDVVAQLRKRCGISPISVGWSPITGCQSFYARMGHHASYLSIDKSHWDWSVHMWLLDAVKIVFKSMVADPPSWWLQLVDQRFAALFENAIWSFQDGSEIVQSVPGIMKSGCYLTIWINSVCQLLLHNYASIILNIDYPIWICGDDTIQHLPEEHQDSYMQILTDLGFSLRFERSSVPEFVGFLMHRYYYVPSYQDKHSFLLRHLSHDERIAEPALQSYQLLYANAKPALAKIRALARKRNLPNAIFDDSFMALIQNQ